LALRAHEPAARPIPLRALTAYQRSETIIGKAAPDCALDWQLLAAVAGVLTDHGERGGRHAIDEDGTVRPDTIGAPLRDADGNQVSDTDGGALDGDPLNDRPVGPFLFDPSVWTVVGVDGDGDGRRDPQDLDDASLAASVLLCSADGDLSRTGNARAALSRFGIEEETADRVLATAAEFRQGMHQPLPEAPLAPVHAARAPSTALPAEPASGRSEENPAPPAINTPVEVTTGKQNEIDEDIDVDVDITEPVDADEDQDPTSEPVEQPSTDEDTEDHTDIGDDTDTDDTEDTEDVDEVEDTESDTEGSGSSAPPNEDLPEDTDVDDSTDAPADHDGENQADSQDSPPSPTDRAEQPAEKAPTEPAEEVTTP
jgi:hypothetical protein